MPAGSKVRSTSSACAGTRGLWEHSGCRTRHNFRELERHGDGAPCGSSGDSGFTKMALLRLPRIGDPNPYL